MPDDTQNVTLKTIADELGVSVSTVARALKDGHKIGEDTIRRVRETALRLGYVRNLDGVKLRTGQTLTIMAILGTTNEEEIGDSGSVGLLNGMHTRLSESEYSLRAIPVTIGDQGLDRVREVVRGRNADGIVLDHTEPSDPRVRYLIDSGVPVVTFGRTDFAEAHAWLDIDNEFAGWQGTDALLRAGHRRIAFLDADARFTFVAQRLRGYQRALAEHGVPFDPALIEHLTLEADIAKGKARALAAAGADAFVCVNELVFLGARAGVRAELGKRSASIGYSVRSGTNIGEYIGTPLHSSHFSRIRAGWTLADLLLRRIGGTPPAQCQELVRTTLKYYDGQAS